MQDQSADSLYSSTKVMNARIVEGVHIHSCHSRQWKADTIVRSISKDSVSPKPHARLIAIWQTAENSEDLLQISTEANLGITNRLFRISAAVARSTRLLRSSSRVEQRHDCSVNLILHSLYRRPVPILIIQTVHKISR